MSVRVIFWGLFSLFVLTLINPRIVNAGDADVTIQSSDGVLFRLHRKYLEANTSAFPGPDAGPIRSDRPEDVVYVTEPADILEILFEFVYPRRHPTLEGIKAEILLPLAEAVEKYEVFSAVTTCDVQLKLCMLTHPAEVLSHAVKHDRPYVNEAALCLARTPRPLNEILGILTPTAQIPWVNHLLSLLWTHGVLKPFIRFVTVRLGEQYSSMKLMDCGRISMIERSRLNTRNIILAQAVPLYESSGLPIWKESRQSYN
ncbi:hypothetical protein GALMADRAFT_78291 [Galerina marginata CBS 339.88]|uniref:BTB domain-containing protein n=1 Tax=Galerina marginata (strain CBS 339.88) TaxID=685588 RepID=A0A067SFG4_GALM3|nr:hypothetical protein GALMADRAFT_78291 [Galerina marginata CBS 339.88]